MKIPLGNSINFILFYSNMMNINNFLFLLLLMAVKCGPFFLVYCIFKLSVNIDTYKSCLFSCDRTERFRERFTGFIC